LYLVAVIFLYLFYKTNAVDIPKDVAKTFSYKLYVVFHICPVNEWKNVVSEQINSIQSSGLYDALEKLYVCTSPPLGLSDSETLVKKYFAELNLAKVEFLCSTSSRTFENATMNAMVDKSVDIVNNDIDAFFLYIHNKGTFHPNNQAAKWRRSMMRHVVHNWNQCAQLLDMGFKTAGPFYNWTTKYYSGNFWWARATFLASRKKIDANGYRGLAESFLMDHEMINVKEHANLKGLSIWDHYTRNFI
jgi:hypothetical protein